MSKKGNKAELVKILKRTTPKFNYGYVNTGKDRDLSYFKRMTPEMLERILHILDEIEADDYAQNCFHNTAIQVLPIIAGIPGTLLHGYWRISDPTDVSVEGAYIPEEFGDLFLDRINALRLETNDPDVYVPDEWDREIVIHYTVDDVFVETDCVTDIEEYRKAWSDGIPDPERNWEYKPEWAEFWQKARGKIIPEITKSNWVYRAFWG